MSNTRRCPSCHIRYVLDRTYNPNFDMLPLDKDAWEKLRRAAESFDRRASNLDSEEYRSGTGDGTLFTAAAFIEWIKPDCEGFKERRPAVDYDGVRHDGLISSADPIPFAPMPSRMRRVGR